MSEAGPVSVDAAPQIVPPSVRSASLAALDGIAHGFFGRQGGVSTGIYASLNTGPGSNDAPEAVAENRARIAAAIGAAGPRRLLTAHQIHSADAIHVDGPWRDAPAEGDALITHSPGLALGALAADCAPVLLADAEAGVIGAAHAGWKGALAGITDAAIAAMVDLGASRARIIAAIGPCISQAEYEVGPEFRDRFHEAEAGAADFFAPGAGDRWQFDLKGYVARRLRRADIGAVDVLAACTCADEARYFSNRRRNRREEPDYGRNLSVIMLRQR